MHESKDFNNAMTSGRVDDTEVRAEFSNHTNLIEQSAYRYSLQERETPNLYRHLFDYESVPKVSFNHRFVPVQMTPFF